MIQFHHFTRVNGNLECNKCGLVSLNPSPTWGCTGPTEDPHKAARQAVADQAAELADAHNTIRRG